MSLNMQQTLRSLVTSPESENKLAKVKGVVIASKVPPGVK